MRLAHICDLELGDQSGLACGPLADENETGLVTGKGSASGAQVSGQVCWIIHTRREPDGSLLPDVYGMITTEEGAQIRCSLLGRTLFRENGKVRQERHLFTTRFEVEDEGYRWLSHSFCLAEGRIHPETRHLEVRIYVCIHELL